MNSLIIVIPHYNDLDGLKKTLISVIEDIKIDVIVIDDGSEDKIDESKVNFNGNIFFKYLSHNSGIGDALNIGLEYALQHSY